LNVSVFRFACKCLGIHLDIEDAHRPLVLPFVDGPLGGLRPSFLVSAVGRVIEVCLDLSVFVDTHTPLDVAVLLVF
jgi:hypothetical protein